MSDVHLLAFVIMPNHLHLVLRQGVLPLSRFMQPLLRRIALHVQRAHGREGYVFERRYRERSCGDPDYLRNAIVYTHLNPVRAGLCEDPADYAWSSHNAWQGIDPGISGLVPLTGAIQLFAVAPQRCDRDLRGDYATFMGWRRAYDAWLVAAAEGTGAGCSPPPPPVAQGDAHWKVTLSSSPALTNGHAVSGEPVTGEVDPSRPDLRAIAEEALAETEPGLDLYTLRSRFGGPLYVKARHQVVLRAAALGYRNTQIAAYLRLSSSAVSDVITADRKRRFLGRR